MTTRKFKAFVSVIIAVVLMMSVCSVSFVSAVTEDEMAALGISGGNSVHYVESPDGSGKTVVLYDATNIRPNVELKNDWVNGTTYTVKLEYWLAKEHTGGSFQFYYGEAPTKSGKTASTSFNIDNSFIGDGQWHTKYVKFTYNVPSSKPNNKNVYLTFFSGGRFKMYVKDIVVKAESFANMPGDFDHLKKDATSLNNQSDFTYGSNGMLNKSSVAADGSVVFTPSGNGNWTLSTHVAGTKQYVQFVKIHNGDHGRITLMPGNTYSVSVEYKAVKLRSGTNDGGFALGYLGVNGKAEGYTGNGSNPVCYLDVVKWTEINEEYNTYNYTFTYNGTGNADLVLVIPFQGQSVAIKSTMVSRKTANAELISLVTYNDNGYITTFAGYIGEPITTKGNNGYLGEECKGWSDNVNLTGENVTTIPANDTTLYAKYNTVVIDNFNMNYAFRGGYDSYNTTDFVLKNHSSIKMTTTTVGFMLPAYDAVGDNDNSWGHYDWYKFEAGKKYSIAFEAKDISVGSKGNTLTVTSATAAGSGGKRNQSGEVKVYSFKANDKIDRAEFGVTFTCKFASGYESAVLRGTTENISTSLSIEKIIITKIDDETPVAAFNAVSLREESEKYTAGIRVRGRINGNVFSTANQVGFVVVPTALLGESTIEEYMNNGGIGAFKAVAYDKAEGVDVIYSGALTNSSGAVAAYKDYQVKFTGLTGAVDMRGWDITFALYVTTDNGTVYLDEYTTSYNAVAGK